MTDDLGWVHTSMERVHEKLDRFIEASNSVLSSIREDIAAIKAADTKAEIDKLNNRVTVLESVENQRSGAVKLADWLHKLGPWIGATALVLAANWPKLFG